MTKPASRLVGRILATAWCLLALLHGGCLGYRLGTSLPPGIRRIHVPTFKNASNEPLIETALTQATIQEFQRDGTVKISAADRADAELEVKITTFRAAALTREEDNLKTTGEYRLNVWVEVVLRSKTDGVLFTRTAHGWTTFEPAGDLWSAKQEALPAAAQDLAREIVKLVVEFW